MLFFCHHEADELFSIDCEEVEAHRFGEAAEIFAAKFFDDEGADRPIEVIVAETQSGLNAMKFKVERTITITDDAREMGEVEIPAPDDED